MTGRALGNYRKNAGSPGKGGKNRAGCCRDFPARNAGIHRIAQPPIERYGRTSMTRVSGNPQPKEVDSMETAKVDIRKLQLLNDRINQCIDALNQVRLSVHGLSQGLSHTSPQSSINPGSPFGFGFAGAGASPFTNPLTQAGVNPFGLGQTGFPQGQVSQIPVTPGFTSGLSHSGGLSPFVQGVNPYL